MSHSTSSPGQGGFPRQFPRRGEIYQVDFGQRVGSEQEGQRPCVVVSNDINNQRGSVVLVVPLTTNMQRGQYPQNAIIKGGGALPMDSVALGEQLTVVSKQRLIRNRGSVNAADLADIERALRVILALGP